MSVPNDTGQLVQINVPGTTATIAAAEIDGKPMVALRPMCQAIGIDADSQAKKLKSKSWACTVMSTVHDNSGRRQEMLMIDRRTMTMWLATLDENRVSAEAKPVVIAFQAEAADALDAYFHTGQAINPRGNLSTFDILRAQIDQLEAAQRTAEEAKAIATKTEARLDAIEGRHDWFAAVGYAKIHGIENTSTQYLAKVGRQAASIARANGIEPVKVQHALYGLVNTLPAWVWETAFEGRAA